ncbi:MAG: sulfite exporter TauE/SafE family protein [Acidobacteriota bacterium]|nr:sulfite exporter TauE/SafE family protein [Acidobacteriota bacterium]
MNLIAGLTAFFLGAMHALEPGHGKSAIAAYAVGYRSSLRHILLLGLTTAFAHTISILILAAIFGAAIANIADEKAHQWIAVGSSFLILLTGAWLLQRAYRQRKSNENCAEAESSCNCGTHRAKQDSDKQLSFGVVGLLGISTGLIPCPTALAVLLSAMTAGRFFGGLWTVCLFSAGLALTLCAVALAASLAAKLTLKNQFVNSLNFSRWRVLMPMISACLITGSGLFMLFRAVFYS